MQGKNKILNSTCLMDTSWLSSDCLFSPLKKTWLPLYQKTLNFHFVLNANLSKGQVISMPHLSQGQITCLGQVNTVFVEPWHYCRHSNVFYISTDGWSWVSGHIKCSHWFSPFMITPQMPSQPMDEISIASEMQERTGSIVTHAKSLIKLFKKQHT